MINPAIEAARRHLVQLARTPDVKPNDTHLIKALNVVAHSPKQIREQVHSEIRAILGREEIR